MGKPVGTGALNAIILSLGVLLARFSKGKKKTPRPPDHIITKRKETKTDGQEEPVREVREARQD